MEGAAGNDRPYSDPARAHLRLDEGNVGRLHIDDHLVRPRSRVGYLLGDQDRWRPELVYDDRAHSRSVTCAGSEVAG